MKLKGSKYAKKHPIQITIDDDKNLPDNLSQKDDEAIWEILYEPYNFIERFEKLSYAQQIGMIVTLNTIIKEQEKRRKKGTAADFAESAEHCLNKIHEQMNSTHDVGIYSAISDDEKRLIRMDCYGKINKRAPHQLSYLYTFFRKSENLKKAKLADYDLKNSPSWRVFNQFESFRSIAPKIRYWLFKEKINPEAIKAFTVSDFCDVIFNAYQKDNSETSASFISPEKNIKASHIKKFMRHCGEVFEEQMVAQGIDPRCAASLCNQLRRFGNTYIETLSVTETHYTPRILTDLSKAGFDVSKINIGDRIDPDFANKLIDEHQEGLILARDENGKLLDKSALPRLQLHHKHAVQFSASNGYLARANYPNNLLLVEDMMHAKYYHLFDQIIKQDKMNNMYSRLNVASRIMTSVIGFKIDDAIYYDFENNKAFRKREAKDKACIVNYMDMMEERTQNEIELIKKYDIPYNTAALDRSERSIKAIMAKNNQNSENMKKFQKWFAQQKKTKGGK